MAAAFQDCIVLFGDSLTQQQDVVGGMQDRFSNAYRRHLDVLNRGYSGYNTRWARVLWDTIFARVSSPAQTVRLVTIWFGANDSALPELNPRQHVPLEEYTANLRFFLDALTAPDSPYAAAHEKGLNIVLVTPPPVCERLLEKLPFPLDRSLENTRQYAEAVRSLGREFKEKEKEGSNWRIGVVNIFDGILEAAQGTSIDEYLSDGLHLTTKGYAVFWDAYTALVKNEFRGRGLNWEDGGDLPRRVQNWDQVDLENPVTILDNMKLPPIRQ